MYYVLNAQLERRLFKKKKKNLLVYEFINCKCRSTVGIYTKDTQEKIYSENKQSWKKKSFWMACTFWTCHTCRANTRTLVWYSVLFNSKVKNWTWHNSYWQTHNYSSSHVYGMEYDFAVQLYQLICMEKSPSIVFEAIWKLIGTVGFLCDERSSCCTWGLRGVYYWT